MSILNRLSKIEDKLNINSQLCACPKETVFKIVPSGESEESNETSRCEICRKPMPDPLRVTFSFNNDIKIVEQTTDYTREEFEEWQKNHVVSKHISYEEYLAEKQ